jgi:hypothetical protein
MSDAIRAQEPALGRRYRAEAGRSVELTTAQRSVRDDILRRDRPEDWQEAECLCGETQGIVLSEIDRHGLPYRKILCGTCGLLRASPRWTARRYAEFYQREYRDLYKPVEGTKEEFVKAAVASAGVRSIASWVTGSARRFDVGASPTIVEIGTGGGWNLANLPATWVRIGFDVDSDYLAAGRSTADIDLRHGFLDEAISTGCVGAANIVLLSHVLEHFIDPIEQLGSLRRAMSPEAVLMIEVPGVLDLHRNRHDPMRVMQNAHIHTFCAKTLAAACVRAGYRVLEVDETARAVCRPDTGPNRAAPRPSEGPALSRRVFGYLRSCERGTGVAQRLRLIPFIGRPAAALFRRVWFPLVRLVYR